MGLLTGAGARIAGFMSIKVWLYLILLAFVGGIWAGTEIQQTIDRAADADALEDTAKATEAQADRTATTNQTGHREGAKAQVENEDRSNAKQEQIRVVYRTVHVAADCRQPDGVRHVLDEAIGRANDRVRASAGAVPAVVPDGRAVPRR